jgi:hypothetical protein
MSMNSEAGPVFIRPLLATRKLWWLPVSRSEYVLQDGLEHFGSIRLKFWRGATAEVLGETFRTRHRWGKILLCPPESDLELATLPARRTLPQRELTLASGQAFTIQSDRHSFRDMLVDQAIFDAEKQPLVAFCATSSKQHPREAWLQVHSQATKLAELPLLITVAGYLALTA